MNVLIVTGHDIWGSPKAFSPIKNLLLALGQNGHKAIFLTNDKVNDDSTLMYGPPVREFHQNVIVKRFHIPGDSHIYPIVKKIPVLRCLRGKLRMEILFPGMAFFFGISLARKYKVDILYSYEIYGSFVAFLLAKIFRTPLVLRYQGTLMSHVFAEAKKNLRGKLNVLRYYLHIFALKLPADLIVMTDDGTLGEDTVRKLGNKSRMVFWRNGFDYANQTRIEQSKEEIRRELGLPKDAKVMLSVGRLVDWKRVERIFRALPDLVEKIPGFYYVCVGTGKMRQQLYEIARQSGVLDRVLFAGHKDHKDVIKYFHAADVFISTNDWSNVGNTTLEAMLCGLPVVVYNIGDTSKVVKNMQNGILLDRVDPKAVAQGVVDVLMNEQLRRKLGVNAKKWADTNLWTWEQRMAAEIGEMQKLVDKKLDK